MALNWWDNMWETKDMQDTRHSREAADKRAAEADRRAQEAAEERRKAKEAIKGYKAEEFKFDANNPYVEAQKRMIGASATQGRKQLASSLASRGVLNSGQSARMTSRALAEEGTQLANVAGQDYLRQFQDYRNEEQQRYQRLLGNYNLESEEYGSYMQDFYNNLSVAQEQANMNYQLKQQQFQNIMQVAEFGVNVAKTAAGA